MIVYQRKKLDFLKDILTNDIDGIIEQAYIKATGRHVPEAEKRSWRESMQRMNNVLLDNDIPSDSGITIEYQIPQTTKRIDFVISGRNSENIEHAVLVELKQWQKINKTNKDGIVETFIGHGLKEVTHPSYQVWSYFALLKWFNQSVYERGIELKPCAYLHNYSDDGIITDSFYKTYIDRAPLFLKPDNDKLRDFIKRYIKHGDNTDLMYTIDNGKIKPSKHLSDVLGGMLKRNIEFAMVDDQKVVYEQILANVKYTGEDQKSVIIVRGGPGTGKTVVAINILSELSKIGLNSRYVSKNAAPRTVYQHKLTGLFTSTEITNFFSGSGAFVDADQNSFDVLIVDEAHRLNEKSGLYGNLGDNQIKEIINAGRVSIFFIDEDQKVTLKDIGDTEKIKDFASAAQADIVELELTSQFRCNGSDGYIAWLDNALEISDTANKKLDLKEFDFKVFDSITELRDRIFKINKEANKARLVAGYCWDWVSRRDPAKFDISIPEENFAMKWNLATDGSLWLVAKQSVNEIGCIHSCQGLEMDYVGVIIGPDLLVRNGKIIADPSKRAKSDASLKGYKLLSKLHPDETLKRVDKIIKNTYRTLMTRGMKGCYIYSQDKETRDFFKSILNSYDPGDTSRHVIKN